MSPNDTGGDKVSRDIFILSIATKIVFPCFPMIEIFCNKCFEAWASLLVHKYLGLLHHLNCKEYYTEYARDRDLYKLVSYGKFVNDILFSTLYKTHYLTLGHHSLAVINVFFTGFGHSLTKQESRLIYCNFR